MTEKLKHPKQYTEQCGLAALDAMPDPEHLAALKRQAKEQLRSALLESVQLEQQKKEKEK